MRWKEFAAALVATATLGANPAEALYLDEDHHFRFYGIFYSQARFRMQDSDAPQHIRGGGTRPEVNVGDLIQWRNQAYPVFEGRLSKALRWRWIDDLSFRFAGRFVYDGIYDVGPDVFRRGLRSYKVSGNSSPLGGTIQAPVFRGTQRVEQLDGSRGPCGDPSSPPFFSPACELANAEQRARRLGDQELFDPRNEFAQNADPWEIYLNIEKRPFFLRIGKQNLSWGESDGQRLLDQINPIDRFFGLPFDEDIDEQRIPVWMARGNVQLFRSWGPFSSLGVEGFWVPGPIVNQQNPFNVSGNHPFGPPSGCDPQFIADELGRANTGGTRDPDDEGCTLTSGGASPDGLAKTSIYERLPEKKLGNGRFGARVVGLLFRDYTFSIGAYRTWADIPQPRVHYLDILDVPGAQRFLPTTVVAELTHGQVDILGATVSFYQPHWLPGVVRAEVGYFKDEPAFVPIANQGYVPTIPEIAQGRQPFIDTFVPEADYLRWVIGYDVQQLNVPFLSQTNNIIVVSQWFNALNLSGDAPYRNRVREIGLEDENQGRFAIGVPQPDGSVTVAPKYQAIWNITFQAFLMHGALIPQFTFVADLEKSFAILPNVTYRISDALLLKVGYTAIMGSFFNPGFFRDRDQVGIRLTWQLN